MVKDTLLKLLTTAGIGSRRRMADAIKQGKVAVNGETVTGFRHPVDRETDHITVDGRPVVFEQEKLLYIILNKPKGVLSTTSDERGRRTVMDILPDNYRHLRLYPAGRLDRDSTGLLLLTNDGELTYRLTHPRFEHEKEYLVRLNSALKADDKSRLERGIALDDGMTYPSVIMEIDSSPPFNYSLVLHEGRKRQVRRMFATLGYRVLALKRVRMGNLRLGNLREGASRELSGREVRGLGGD